MKNLSSISRKLFFVFPGVFTIVFLTPGLTVSDRDIFLHSRGNLRMLGGQIVLFLLFDEPLSATVF